MTGQERVSMTQDEHVELKRLAGHMSIAQRLNAISHEDKANNNKDVSE